MASSFTLRTFLDNICQILDCAPSMLVEKLKSPEIRIKVKETFGPTTKLETTYRNRNGLRHAFFFDGLTVDCAAEIPAYGLLRRPFNINVAAHMYARHKILLRYPDIPCAIEQQPRGAVPRFYPLELLRIVDPLVIVDHDMKAEESFNTAYLPRIPPPGFSSITEKINEREESPISELFNRSPSPLYFNGWSSAGEEPCSEHESDSTELHEDTFQLTIWVKDDNGEWSKKLIRIDRSEVEKMN